MSRSTNFAKDPFEKGINTIFDNMKNGKCCENCGSFGGENGKLLMCSGCKCTFYCGAKCQKEDWKRHKVECCENLDVKIEKERMDDEMERRWSEENVDRDCVESWKKEYKKNQGKTPLMSFYESFWRSEGELYLLERARKEAKEEMEKEKKMTKKK